MKSKTRVVDAKNRAAAAGPTSMANFNALEKAKLLAQKISEEKNLTAVNAVDNKDSSSITAAAVMRGETTVPLPVSVSNQFGVLFEIRASFVTYFE
jgi:hypothetical protein